DVGNVAVPRAVLGYPGKITGPAWQFIHLHTLVGERLLAGPLGMEPVSRLVRHSHERWDGAGYPDELAGGAIPLGSRIVFAYGSWPGSIHLARRKVSGAPDRWASPSIGSSRCPQWSPKGTRSSTRPANQSSSPARIGAPSGPGRQSQRANLSTSSPVSPPNRS